MPKNSGSIIKSLVWFSIIFAILLFTILTVFLFIPLGKAHAELEIAPEQTAQVEVVKTISGPAKYGNKEYIHFKFADGTEKKFKVDNSVFRNTQAGDVGMLVYKETQRSQNVDERLFISFKNDVERPYIPAPDDSWLAVLFIAFSIGATLVIIVWSYRQELNNLKKRLF